MCPSGTPAGSGSSISDSGAADTLGATSAAGSNSDAAGDSKKPSLREPCLSPLASCKAPSQPVQTGITYSPVPSADRDLDPRPKLNFATGSSISSAVSSATSLAAAHTAACTPLGTSAAPAAPDATGCATATASAEAAEAALSTQLGSPSPRQHFYDTSDATDAQASADSEAVHVAVGAAAIATASRSVLHDAPLAGSQPS